MKPKQHSFTNNPDQLLNDNGVATAGIHHSTEAMRLVQLEKQNNELKIINEQHAKEFAAMVIAHKRYISLLAHDLKNPISNIYTALEILRGCLHDKKYEEMEGFIDIASGSALNTTNMIENILVWIQSQSIEKRFNPQQVNLKELVVKEIESSCLPLRIKKITLTHSIPLEFNLLADLRMSQSIIRNLISNAIKFTPPGGNITISATESGSYIEIMVQDDGIGINIKQQQDLFEQNPFENNNGKNKGFGLALCKEFIETHGGTLRVVSQQDHGSSFIFTLPASD